MGGSDVHDMSYYGKCMIGGILSCGLTHMAVCPLDIVKCRKQVRFFPMQNGTSYLNFMPPSNHYSLESSVNAAHVIAR